MTDKTLTIETMRRDIARLLHIDPAEIHDDDNLVDLGLDSMRTMSLAVAWGEAGASVEFSDLMSGTTLAHWWALVQAADAA